MIFAAKVITDRDSGRSRGFGFVSFTSADAANSALQDMDGKVLCILKLKSCFTCNPIFFFVDFCA